MCGLFKQLCILESINELKLFTLHSSHICLILGLFVGLASQFFFELLPCAILPLNELLLSLLGGLLLLLLDHVLHVASTLLLCRPLLLVHLASGLFLHLGVESSLLLALHGCHLAILDSFGRLLLVLTIHLAPHRLIHRLLTEALLFGLLVLDVSLSLTDDLIRTLPSLINLFHYL